VLFERLADVTGDWRHQGRYRYGQYGTPTTLELGLRIAEIESARHTFIVPGGLSAISLVYFACCRAGSHVLVPRTAYGPHSELAGDLLARFGITVEHYPPEIGSGIGTMIRPDTALVWCESPGSVTMELQDVPAIVSAARQRGVPVAIDNTYSAGVMFDAFGHGVDISVQALTKYISGHSDVLLGSVSVASESLYDRVGSALAQLGLVVSPDDCALTLRGLKTLGVRLGRLEQSTLEVARWLKARPEVAEVRHPAFVDCPGHDIWVRDFSGSTSVFSIILRDGWDRERVAAFVDGLRLFGIGFSWGGVSSLVMAYPDLTRLSDGRGARLVRLNIGLEEPADLIADLLQSLEGAAAAGVR
jgi:cystathionine beta-lyase